MVNQKLNPKILSKLLAVFPERSKGSIQARLSQLSNKNGITLGAAAEIMIRQKNRTVNGLLDDEDRACLRNSQIKVIGIKKHSGKIKEKILEFVKYSTTDPFLKAHLEEINKTYHYGCYTSSFILIRKVIENLIVDMIKKKFPGKNKEDKVLYLDTDRGRIHDLSILLKNIRSRLKDFDPDESKLIARILQKADEFKDDANDKTHSLYHISNKKELDEKEPQMILNLISTFFSKY